MLMGMTEIHGRNYTLQVFTLGAACSGRGIGIICDFTDSNYPGCKRQWNESTNGSYLAYVLHTKQSGDIVFPASQTVDCKSGIPCTQSCPTVHLILHQHYSSFANSSALCPQYVVTGTDYSYWWHIQIMLHKYFSLFATANKRGKNKWKTEIRSFSFYQRTIKHRFHVKI